MPVHTNPNITLPVILDGSDLDRLIVAEEKLSMLNDLFIRADNCGVECESNKQFARKLRETISGLKREFLEGEITRRASQ